MAEAQPSTNHSPRVSPGQLSNTAVSKIGKRCALFAFNRDRQAFLAQELKVARTHWRRLIGLLTTDERSFGSGKGLWITPCHGVHTLAMRYAIDVAYLNKDLVVVHLEENLKPWRVAPVRIDTATVLELPAHIIRSTQTRVGDQICIERRGN